LRCYFGGRRQQREASGDVKFGKRRREIYRRGICLGIIHIDNFARPVTTYLDFSVFAKSINECSRNRGRRSSTLSNPTLAGAVQNGTQWLRLALFRGPNRGIVVRKGTIDVHGHCSSRGFVICKAGSSMSNMAPNNAARLTSHSALQRRAAASA
jgi:hypothetical protein